MNNAELIKALRCEAVINDEHPRCESCKYGVVVCHGSREDVYGCDSRRIENDAADALEAAEAQLPKEGEWIEVHDWIQIPQEERGTYRCSACGQVMKYPWNYCPNCGARMRGMNDKQKTESKNTKSPLEYDYCGTPKCRYDIDAKMTKGEQ